MNCSTFWVRPKQNERPDGNDYLNHERNGVVIFNTDDSNQAVVGGQVDQPDPLGIPPDAGNIRYAEAHQISLVTHHHDVIVFENLP